MITCLEAVQINYESRVDEINQYFDFISKLESQGDFFGKQFPDIDNREILKTLKANCFLLLYNLMESVTKSTIQGLYDHLKEKNVKYDDCCERIKKVVLKNAVHEKNRHTLQKKLKKIVLDIVTETFLVETLLSGSVDAQSLRKLAGEYGFSGHLAGNGFSGERLVEVKNKRNDLAHGEITFNEAGRDTSLNDLEDIKTDVFGYMQQFIINVDVYLSSRQYLASPAILD